MNDNVIVGLIAGLYVGIGICLGFVEDRAEAKRDAFYRNQFEGRGFLIPLWGICWPLYSLMYLCRWATRGRW